MKSTQYLEHAGDAKDCSGSDLESHAHSPEFSFSANQLNQDFDKSLVLKSSSAYSYSIELKNRSNLTMKQSEVSDTKKETKRRYAEETGLASNGNDAYLDLKLSPPGVYLRGKSLIESKSSSPRSQDSCVSAEVESNANLENNPRVEGSSLILMGCTFCLLYMMVTDSDPRCPKCKNSGLLDIFRGNQAKRSRKN